MTGRNDIRNAAEEARKAAMERAHAALAEQWERDSAPETHYVLKMECDAKALSEAAEIFASTHVSNLRVTFDANSTPQFLAEFDARFSVWETARHSLESVSAPRKWYRQGS